MVGWGIVLFLVGVLVLVSYYCLNFFIKFFDISYMFCFGIFGVLMFFVVVIFIKFKFVYDFEDEKVENIGLMNNLK